MARLLAFALVLLGGIAALWLWLASGPAPVVSAAAPRAEHVPDGATADVATAAEPDAAQRGALSSQGPPASAVGAEAPALVDWSAVPPGAAPEYGVVIEVVDGPTGLPVPGATLLYVDPALAPYDALQKVDDLAQVDALLVAHGARYVSDERGRAIVPRPFQRATLLGRQGASWGQLGVGTQSVRALLELYPDAPLVARVEDAAGRGVPEIPVRLWHRLGKQPNAVPATAVSDADGGVLIPHALWSARAADPNLKLVARVNGVFSEPVEAECPARAIPAEPLVLVLPPFGSAGVRVLDAEREPVGSSVAVALRPYQPDEEENYEMTWVHEGGASWSHPAGQNWYTAVRAQTEQGLALFPCVELGLELEAASGPLHSMFSATAVGNGPRTQGEAVALEVELEQRHPIALVELVDESGAPRAGSRVQAWCVSQNAEGNHVDSRGYAALADAAGRIELPLPTRWEPGFKRRLTVTETVGAGCQRSGVLDFPAPLADARFEAGRLELKLPGRLVAGRVLDDQGAPVQHAVVWAERKAGTPEKPRWNRVATQSTTMTADGAFEILANDVQGTIRVLASHPDWVGCALETLPGTTGLELRLQAAAGTRGRVVCESFVPHKSLRVSAKLADQAPAGGYVTTQWSSQPRADGSFAALGLYPGRYTFTVSVGSMRETLATIENVQIGPGVDPDPRLDPIDARGRVRRMQFEVVDLGQQPLQEGWLRWWPPGGDPEQESRYENVRDGLGELFTLRENVDVEASGHDLRRERVLGAHGGERIVLGPALAVQLVLAAEVQVPEGCELVPGLVDVYGEEHRTWDLDEYERAAGFACHPSHPGPARVTWMLARLDEWEFVEVEVEPQQRLEVLDVMEAQRFVLSVPAEAIEQARQGFEPAEEE